MPYPFGNIAINITAYERNEFIMRRIWALCRKLAMGTAIGYQTKRYQRYQYEDDPQGQG